MRNALFAVSLGLAVMAQPSQKLFDGKTFQGWEGDTKKTWRIENGALVGGSLTETVPRNDFLVTTRQYGNFILTLKFKLEGTEGFINGGVQFRSQRLKEPAHEMTGYQADLGAKYWGSLYDESRRNKTLVQADEALISKILKPNDWNDYEIRADGPRIQIFLNGQKTVDYTEPDSSIPQTGYIGLQIHGGGKAQVSYKDLVILVTSIAEP
ncbi:MAG TPA: DUF1080 domain-containing protein [Vicinamibacterales bacterium]|jgi:hypothetical protein